MKVESVIKGHYSLVSEPGWSQTVLRSNPGSATISALSLDQWLTLCVFNFFICKMKIITVSASKVVVWGQVN